MTAISRYELELPGFVWALLVGFLGTLVTLFELVLLFGFLGTRIDVKGPIFLALLGSLLALSAVATYRTGFNRGYAEAREIFAYEKRHPSGRNPYTQKTKGSTLAWILAFGLIGLTYRAFYQLGRYRAYWEVWKVLEAKKLKRTARKPSVNLTQELARLAELHQKGALTEEEFKRAKARLLQ